jgi:NADH:ubiquinone oxidoreductase subunit K
MLLGGITVILFFFVKEHLLKILLFLEFFMLNIVYVIILRVFFEVIRVHIIFIYFSLAVCEARVGVGILIGLVRRMGRDRLDALW